MRHAHCEQGDESVKNDESELTEEGKLYLTSDAFKESITRVNPDIIVTSKYKRAVMTAAGAQKVMKELHWKDIQIEETDKLAFWMTEENVWEIYDWIRDTYKGKRVLLISHKKRWRRLWKHVTWFGECIHTHEMHERLNPDYCEVMPLPTQPLHNELDQWIYAELNGMVQELDQAMEGYTLEPATKVLLSFVEKLTNRYVRRSRRRFRASGMDQDKQSAYQTLRTVLITYLQCASPYVPFITEHIWQEMWHNESIHLSYRPMSSEKWVNHELISESNQSETTIEEFEF